jgi:hypothetical protein
VTEDDKQRFASCAMACAETYGRDFSKAQLRLYFGALQALPIEAVELAVQRHMADPEAGKYFPKPADLLAQAQGFRGGDNRPGADEAWALALRCRDESDTVVWTAEIAQAFAICRAVLDAGDKIGARQAFKGAYERIVHTAREARRPVAWTVSLGWDVQRRDAELARAQAAGLLTDDVVEALLLPAPKETDPTPPDKARENLTRLRAELAKLESPSAKAERIRVQRLEADREATEQRKRDIAAQVSARL